MVLTKTRLLKHDLHFHGPLRRPLGGFPVGVPAEQTKTLRASKGQFSSERLSEENSASGVAPPLFFNFEQRNFLRNFPRNFRAFILFGLLQKVFSEKASAIARMRQKCVNGSSFIGGTEERSKMHRKCVKIVSEMRQKCAEHLWGRTPFAWTIPICGSERISQNSHQISR